jgi:type I restriction enzyme M protein
MSSPTVSFSDPLGRYYTTEIISKLLISELSSGDPKLVLDLGCGDGALSRAAISRWTDALYVTVDIDRSPNIFPYSDSGRAIKHLHHQIDALSPDLMRSIGIAPESVDLALCNPPFIKQKWRSDYESILKAAGLVIDRKAVKHTSAEFVFIAQNLTSLKASGQLGLIVPDGFVSGEKNKALRAAILNEHSIDSVIKLPQSVFVGTEAQAHIIIITKNGRSDSPIKLKSFSSLDRESETICVDRLDAVKTLDYDYYSAMSGVIEDGSQTLRSMGCEIVRGQFNSKQARDAGFPVLHTCDLRPGATSISLTRFASPPATHGHITVEAGDILVARVGRDLHTRICIVTDGSMPITDCIWRVRAPSQIRDSVLCALTSSRGRELIKSRAHGVSARHLPRDYLLDLPIF